MKEIWVYRRLFFEMFVVKVNIKKVHYKIYIFFKKKALHVELMLALFQIAINFDKFEVFVTSLLFLTFSLFVSNFKRLNLEKKSGWLKLPHSLPSL